MDFGRDAGRLIARLSDTLEAEFLLIRGNLDNDLTSEIVSKCEHGPTRPNVVLTLITLGGDPDAGYRLARYLQNKFQRFSVFVPSLCKSAGTLVAVGAHEIIIGPFGELGPLDVQFYKIDELDEISSGLVAKAAIDSLEMTAIAMFERFFLKLQRKSGGLVTLRTATDIAAEFVAKLLSPVYAQINPFAIGENDLAMRVAKDYAERLANHSGSLKSPEALQLLVEGYASHDFVIDRIEAETIFNNVRNADQNFLKLIDALQMDRLMASYDDSEAIGMRWALDSQTTHLGSVAARGVVPPAESERPRQFHRVVNRKHRGRAADADN
jgi:hypothetical protein